MRGGALGGSADGAVEGDGAGEEIGTKEEEEAYGVAFRWLVRVI